MSDRRSFLVSAFGGVLAALGLRRVRSSLLDADWYFDRRGGVSLMLRASDHRITVKYPPVEIPRGDHYTLYWKNAKGEYVRIGSR